MNTKEFKVIDAINLDVLDSSLWGLCGSEVEASIYNPHFEGKLPPHIYVYGNDEEMYGCELDRLLKNGYDKKLYYTQSQYVAFFWLAVGKDTTCNQKTC